MTVRRVMKVVLFLFTDCTDCTVNIMICYTLVKLASFAYCLNFVHFVSYKINVCVFLASVFLMF